MTRQVRHVRRVRVSTSPAELEAALRVIPINKSGVQAAVGGPQAPRVVGPTDPKWNPVRVGPKDGVWIDERTPLGQPLAAEKVEAMDLHFFKAHGAAA